MFVIDKLNWTQIFENRNYPKIPDMAPIKYTGEREEFDVSILQKKRLMKRKIVLAEQSNLFMNVLQ